MAAFWPLLAAVLLWWGGTAAILYLDGLPRRTYGRSMAVASLVALAALVLLFLLRDVATPWSALVGFVAALVLWGWNEMTFLMGYVTGPNRAPCPPGLTGFARFRAAAATLIHHEILIALTAGAIWLACGSGENAVGFHAFLILWVMRLSAKINIHLGAPNVTAHFLPEHLSYLATYFRHRAMNAFFPLAVTAATLACAWLAHLLFLAETGSHAAAGYGLLTALMALAVLEHWLLYLPLPADLPWRFALKGRPAAPSVVDVPPQEPRLSSRAT
ncbi:MAG: putative photosynthetic complex assembly protein PuhE [Beijerinckiaceae bacterium]